MNVGKGMVIMKIRLALLVVLTVVFLVSCSNYEPSQINTDEIKTDAEIEILNSEVHTDFNSLSYRVTNNSTHTLNCNPEQYTLEFEKIMNGVLFHQIGIVFL